MSGAGGFPAALESSTHSLGCHRAEGKPDSPSRARVHMLSNPKRLPINDLGNRQHMVFILPVSCLLEGSVLGNTSAGHPFTSRYTHILSLSLHPSPPRPPLPALKYHSQPKCRPGTGLNTEHLQKHLADAASQKLPTPRPRSSLFFQMSKHLRIQVIINRSAHPSAAGALRRQPWGGDAGSAASH